MMISDVRESEEGTGQPEYVGVSSSSTEVQRENILATQTF